MEDICVWIKDNPGEFKFDILITFLVFILGYILNPLVEWINMRYFFWKTLRKAKKGDIDKDFRNKALKYFSKYAVRFRRVEKKLKEYEEKKLG